jgi:hypothetical protein
MRLSNAKAYPVEGMSLIYANGENVVYQAIFSTEKYGTFTRVDGKWLALAPDDTSLENLSIMDITPADYKVVTDMFDTAQKGRTYLKYDNVKAYEVSYSFEEKEKSMTAAVETSEGCPPATSDIALNLTNRENAIKTAAYGPMNPALPNNKFWQAKTERWSVTVEEAKTSRCGNCAVFIQTPKMLDCIASGLGNESGNDAWGSIEAGDLGYCETFDFKCAASRTCDAWVAGGPVVEESK